MLRLLSLPMGGKDDVRSQEPLLLGISIDKEYGTGIKLDKKRAVRYLNRQLEKGGNV